MARYVDDYQGVPGQAASGRYREIRLGGEARSAADEPEWMADPKR